MLAASPAMVWCLMREIGERLLRAVLERIDFSAEILIEMANHGSLTLSPRPAIWLRIDRLERALIGALPSGLLYVPLHSLFAFRRVGPNALLSMRLGRLSSVLSANSALGDRSIEFVLPVVERPACNFS